MKHKTFEEWMTYVRDEVDEKTRVEFENHLYECDQCMEVYLEAIERQETSFPTVTDPDGFTDGIMAMIEQEKPVTKIENPRTYAKTKFYQKSVFHYLVAATMTLLLMTTGVFQELMTIVTDFENKSPKESITEGIMKETFSFVEEPNQTNKEANE
ncbi:hypothetical protein JOC86_004173 [Bacillus pakistanensis]|uniref:Zinc-finger domain-containing protein n=1 Tax=Rossellomorea pakistanensis TaxID=992288 RepID=A0ABS2NIJ6_9BACI|nr:zf-HC2 domain-containing protein [Bacillus pakistanensis]MBM7587599.1 hypothetical protein [Bacillus pakistanensis]